MLERQHDAFAVVQAYILAQLHLGMRIICIDALEVCSDLCMHSVMLSS